MIRTIFAQGTRAEAFARWGKVADALRERHGKLGAPMDAAREDVLAHMDDPKEHWARLAGTNPLERVSKEIKRRADVAGISPDGAAVVRLVGALMLEQPDEWAVNGPSAVATSAWKAPPGSPILIPLGCPPWQPDQASDRTEDRHPYTKPRDTTVRCSTWQMKMPSGRPLAALRTRRAEGDHRTVTRAGGGRRAKGRLDKRPSCVFNRIVS